MLSDPLFKLQLYIALPLLVVSDKNLNVFGFRLVDPNTTVDVSGYWRPWENGCCSKKLEQIWNQRTCKN